MAPTIRTTVTTFNYNGSGYPYTTIPSDVTVGDVCYIATHTQSTITITTPSGWTRVAGDGTTPINVYRRVIVSGDASDDVTFTLSTAWYSTAPVATYVQDADTTTPEDVVGTLNNAGWGSGTVTATAPTTTVNNTLNLGFFGTSDWSGMTSTVGSPWTETADAQNSGGATAVASLAQATAGTGTNATWTPAVGGYRAGVIIAVAPGSSPASLALSPATITTTPQTQGVTPGAVSVAAAPASVTVTGVAPGISAGATPPQSIALALATVTITPQTEGVSVGGVSLALSPATITVTPVALSDTPGGVSLAQAPATITTTPVALGVTAGSVGGPTIQYDGDVYDTDWSFNGSGHPTLTIPASGVAADDVAYVAWSIQATLTMTTPTGWTRVAGSGGVVLNVYRKVLVSGDLGATTEFTLNNAYYSAAANLTILRGVDTSTPENIVGSVASPGWATEATATGPTTTVDNCLALAFLGAADWDTNSATVASPWTETLDVTGSQTGMTTATLEKATAGAISNAVFTPVGARTLNAVIIAVAPSGGAAAQTPAASSATVTVTAQALGLSVEGVVSPSGYWGIMAGIH